MCRYRASNLYGRPGPAAVRSIFGTQVRQRPSVRMQAAGRLRATPPAPLTEPATIRAQTRELLHETFEAARVRSRRALMPAVRARVQLIHRPAYQPAPLTAMGQAE